MNGWAIFNALVILRRDGEAHSDAPNAHVRVVHAVDGAVAALGRRGGSGVVSKEPGVVAMVSSTQPLASLILIRICFSRARSY
jgi:hypothetical protein